MISKALSLVIGASWVTTSTFGLCASSVSFADCDLRLPDVVGLVKDLALQVRAVDDVEVDDADRADAGEREVERDRRAEATGADDEHARFDDLALPGAADLGHDQVAAVAFHHLRCEHRGPAPPASAGMTATSSPSLSGVDSPCRFSISTWFT